MTWHDDFVQLLPLTSFTWHTWQLTYKLIQCSYTYRIVINKSGNSATSHARTETYSFFFRLSHSLIHKYDLFSFGTFKRETPKRSNPQEGKRAKQRPARRATIRKRPEV